MLDNFRTFDYQGKVYPVNPKYEELFGYRCYPSVLDIPEAVDCAIIRVPAQASVDILRQCAQKGIHAQSYNENPEEYERALDQFLNEFQLNP